MATIFDVICEQHEKKEALLLTVGFVRNQSEVFVR